MYNCATSWSRCFLSFKKKLDFTWKKKTDNLCLTRLECLTYVFLTMNEDCNFTESNWQCFSSNDNFWALERKLEFWRVFIRSWVLESFQIVKWFTNKIERKNKNIYFFLLHNEMCQTFRRSAQTQWTNVSKIIDIIWC